MNCIIYIASPESQEIYVWKINQNKELKLIQTLQIFGQVQPMVVNPKKSILYIGIRPNPKIISFHIQYDGYLTKINEFPIVSPSTHLTINNTGTILYSASYKDNSLSVIEVNRSGNFISTLQILNNLMGCHSSNIEIRKKRLWIPCLKEDCIRLYDINQSETLNKNSLQKINTKNNSGPRHMVFHYSYNYAYLINELNSTVEIIEIHPSIDQVPTITQTISLIPKTYNYYNNIHRRCWASDIHITPDNRWIYCSDRSNSIISYLKILDNGKTLKFKNYQPTEMQPRGFAIDDDGELLVIAGQKSNFFSIYNIHKEKGNLTQLFRSPSGQGPMWITIINQKNN